MKRLLLMTVTMALVAGAWAQKKKVDVQPPSWSEQAIAAKQAIASSAKAGLPFVSETFTRATAPQAINIDLTGLKELVLVTWGTQDGVGYDHSLWAEAKITFTDGTVLWLDEAKFKVKKIEEGWYSVNKNFGGKPLKIQNKGYKRGIIAHANSILVVDLGGKGAKFEAEIGIDEGSAGGSAVFKVLPTSGTAEARALIAAVPGITHTLVPAIGVPLEDWLTTPGNSLEMAALTKQIRRVQKPEALKKQLAEVQAISNPTKQLEAVVELSQKINKVLAMQEQLVWINIRAIGDAVADMKKPELTAKFKTLQEVAKGGFDGIYSLDPVALDNAEKALTLKREILLSNPLLDMDKIIVTRYNLGNSARGAMAPSMGTQPNNWSSQLSGQRTGFDAEIVELSNLRGDKVKERLIHKPQNREIVTDVMLHWDADRMIFTSNDKGTHFQVFEVGLDGKNLKQITDVPESDLEFFDAAYLPNGKLVVNTNLGYHGVPCVNGSDAVGNYALWDPKTKELRRLTFDQDNNWNATVLNNGKVMYTRWEYTDLMHYYSRIVFHMNPDGTEQKALFGSGGVFPNSTFDMQQLPGNTSAFIGVISGHHGISRSGRLIIFDPAKARKGVEGMVQEIPHSKRPIIPLIKDELVNGVWPQFIKPHVLSDKYYLVAAKLNPNSLWGVYLVDVFDNVTLIAEFEGQGLINPIPVVKKQTPPVIPDKVVPGEKEATVYIQDLYEGEGLQGVPRGTVKALRILSYEYAYLRSLSDHVAQGVQSGWDIKRLLGIVPVEADGSVTFKVPANIPFSMQPLDSLGRAVQWMRSWTVGMPGETVSCVGCHEDQNKIAMNKPAMASKIKPHAITPPEGGVRPFTFELEIQPILDRACVACHNGTDLKGGIDYTGGRMQKIEDWAGTREFSKSYLSFHPYFYRQGPEAEMAVLNPYEYSAYNSEMIQILKSGHHNVALTDKEWKTIYNWLDFNCPYNSSMQADPYQTLTGETIDQAARRLELAAKYANAPIDWKGEITAYTNYLKSQPAPVATKPAAETAKKGTAPKVKGFPFSAEQAKAMVKGENKMSVELAPGISMNFVRIPAGQFVMGNDKAQSAPAKKAKVAKPFWMGEIEVSNEQMRALVPSHDSRFIGQQWKDHTTPGYNVNQPERSATKISYEEALEFCRLLSAKLGKKVTLPTEVQWEWAARAGSDSDFWFGDVNTDFGKFENMADKELDKMAVTGIDPQPMRENDSWFPYQAYIPKIRTVNDGNMLMTSGGTYLPNPWGLYDINGNVAEWTVSDFFPDPANRNVVEKVVRGGSWYERPKRATASIRRSFLPWIKVWNVGFRVIIED